MNWFRLPLQNALYNAYIYERWIFLKDSNTLGTVLYTRPKDTNTEDWAGYELLHCMHHWSRAYAHLTITVILPLQDVEAAQALHVQVGSHRGQHTANKMHTLPMKLGDALLMNGPLFVRALVVVRAGTWSLHFCRMGCSRLCRAWSVRRSWRWRASSLHYRHHRRRSSTWASARRCRCRGSIFLWLNTWVSHPPCIHPDVFLFCLYAIAF